MSWRRDAPSFAAVLPSFRIGRALPLVVLVSLAPAAVVAAAHTAASRRSPHWTVSVSTPRVGRLYPGGPPVTVAFRIAGDRGDAVVRQVTASVAVDRYGDVKTVSGTPIPGCAARWFTVRFAPGNPPRPVHLQHAGDTYSGRVELALIDAPIAQDACQRGVPAVTLVVS